MKNIFKLLGIIALATVIGFSIITCDSGDSDNNNESETLAGTFTLDDDTGEIAFSENMFLTGTYNSVDDTITVADRGTEVWINGTYPRIGTGSGLSGKFGKTFDYFIDDENKTYEFTVTFTFSNNNVTLEVNSKEKSGNNNNNSSLSGNYVSDKNSNEYLAFTGSTVTWFIDTDKMFEGTFTVSSNTVTITFTWLASGVSEETGFTVGGTQLLRINQDNSLSFVWDGEVDNEKWIKP